MNYDTVLPPRIRATLLHKPRRLKLWHKIAIGLVLLAGLRHLNTVPQREAAFLKKGQSYHILTEETIWGSHYRRGVLTSRVFEDLCR